MKVWRLLKAIDRVKRDRARVNDFSSPPSRIICPPKMPSRTFERIIKRIETQEKLIEKEFLGGLARYSPKTTK